jgi:hypothetical protein
VNVAHLHLLLNHVPTLGFGVGFGLFVAALLGKSEDLKRASLVVFFVVALMAIPAYLTGNAASFALRDEPAVSQDLVAAEHRVLLEDGFDIYWGTHPPLPDDIRGGWCVEAGRSSIHHRQDRGRRLYPPVGWCHLLWPVPAVSRL